MNFFERLARCGLLSILILSGCESQFIDRVTIRVAADKPEAKITLYFDSNIQTNLMGSLRYRDLATYFLNPEGVQRKTEQIGFTVSRDLFSDPELELQSPVNTLANGISISVGEALAEIQANEPANPKFKLYGYSDTKNKTWAGTAVILSYHDPALFPVGLTSRQGFMPDQKKSPGVVAQLNGPILNEDGTLGRYATFSLFMNLKRVFAEILPSQEVSYQPMKKKKSNF